MNKFNFQYSSGLIIVTVIIPGIISGSPFEYVLALDTGSTKTILQPSSILQLGYSEKDKTKDVGITTGTKTEKGYELKNIEFTLSWLQLEQPKHCCKTITSLALLY